MSRQYLSESDGRVCDEGLGEKSGLEEEFQIASAATSREEIGNPVYPPARRKLAEHGIPEGHAARQLCSRDYEEYDLLIGMDKANLHNMFRICGGDFNDKMPAADGIRRPPGAGGSGPWYTDDFDATWRDVLAGCQGLLDQIITQGV